MCVPKENTLYTMKKPNLKNFKMKQNQDFENVKNYPWFKILFGTTQPAHLISALAAVYLGLLLYPSQKQEVPSTLINLTYLASFSACFGAQIWMTFVSGLSLYFSLPRHHFGRVQQVLFPKYFLINAVLNLITLVVFVRRHNNALLDVISQIVALMVSFVINLFIKLYLAPPLLRLMHVKGKIEEASGVGMEIGKHDVGELKNCPHYMGVYKAFRKVHMTIAVGNIITMACTIFHLYYISSKLCLL